MKVSLPPINQMLSKKPEKKEPPLDAPSLPDPLHSQHQQPVRQHATSPLEYNNRDVYTFDSWHKHLPPSNLSVGLESAADCQCAGIGGDQISRPPMVAPSFSSTYTYRHQEHPIHQRLPYHPHIRHPWYNSHHRSNYNLGMHPSQHYDRHQLLPSPRHRRAYSASESIQPFPCLQVPSGQPSPYHSTPPEPVWAAATTHPTIANSRGGAFYRGRARAHTTAGYLTATMAPPSSPAPSSSLPPSPSRSSSSSSSSMEATTLCNPIVKPTALHPDDLHPLANSLHQPGRPPHRYHCPHCRKSFCRPSSLRIHIYSHTGEKPHVCPYSDCGRRFSVQSNMRRHIRVHTGTNNDSASLRGEHQPHLNDDHLSTLDASPDGLIYQQHPHSPSYHLASNHMLHGH
ncbi:hypothetical protein [Absidia glauca]|uniref:C2H2-type domain-containing protein n=1 Tax=Absidia glauca TaxID=4829 RepID=A0A168PMD9_ABSGL|nr:hypothetical protein [Absidia glauca]